MNFHKISMHPFKNFVILNAVKYLFCHGHRLPIDPSFLSMTREYRKRSVSLNLSKTRVQRPHLHASTSLV
jgi:hypothetical protein